MVIVWLSKGQSWGGMGSIGYHKVSPGGGIGSVSVVIIRSVLGGVWLVIV